MVEGALHTSVEIAVVAFVEAAGTALLAVEQLDHFHAGDALLQGGAEAGKAGARHAEGLKGAIL